MSCLTRWNHEHEELFPVTTRPSPEAEFTPRTFFEYYVFILHKLRFIILVVWFIAMAAGGAYMMDFVGKTSQEFSPPTGSQSYHANNAMREYFPDEVDTSNYAILIQCPNAPEDLTNISSVTAKHMNDYLESIHSTVSSSNFGHKIASFVTYYRLAMINSTVLEHHLVSPHSNKTMIANLVAKVPFSDQISYDIGTTLQDAIYSWQQVYEEKYKNDFPRCSVSVSSMTLIIHLIEEVVEKEMGTIDGVVLPIALLIMALTVKSIRMMLLPAFGVAFTLTISFGIMYTVAISTVVSSSTPPLMMSLSIAMSIDYNLFIASRYISEKRRSLVRSRERQHAQMEALKANPYMVYDPDVGIDYVTGRRLVAEVMRSAGHTILVSGSTLIVCLLGLIFFPTTILNSFGYGCSIAVGVAVVSSLTFSPALLLTFPSFFEGAARNTRFPNCVPLKIQQYLNDRFESDVEEEDDVFSTTAVAATTTAGPSMTPNDTSLGRLSMTSNNSGFHNCLLHDSQGKTDSARETMTLYSTTASDHHSYQSARSNTGPGNLSVSTMPPPVMEKSTPTIHAPPSTPSHQHHINRESKTSVSPRCGMVASYHGSNRTTYNSIDAPTDEELYGPHYATMLREYRLHHTVFRHLQYIMKFPWNLLCVFLVLGIAGGVGSAINDFKTNDAFECYMPRHLSATNNYEQVVKEFGYYFMYPYNVLFSVSSGNYSVVEPSSSVFRGVFDPYVFNYTQGLLRYIAADPILPKVSPNMFYGIHSIGGSWTSIYEALCFDKKFNTSCSGDMLTALSMVTKTRQATYTRSFIGVDPLGDKGEDFYKRFLKLIDMYERWVRETSANASSALSVEKYGPANCREAARVVLQYSALSALRSVSGNVTVYVQGTGPSSMDMIDDIYNLFPVVVGITAGAVLLIVGFSFRSFIVPLRCLLSIAVTEAFVFGFVVMIYRWKPGILEWMHWDSVATTGGIAWLTPIIGFSFVVGIALDYDIFILTRIAELRTEGETPLTTKAAIINGVCSTGPVITSAGLIMAVAFCGLMFSNMNILNVLGIFLVFSVLFDTFIVRTFLVPTLMSLLGDMNWWPRFQCDYLFSTISQRLKPEADFVGQLD